MCCILLLLHSNIHGKFYSHICASYMSKKLSFSILTLLQWDWFKWKKTPMKKYLKHLTQLEKVVMHFFGKQQFDSPHTSHMYHELCMKRLKYTSLSPCINWWFVDRSWNLTFKKRLKLWVKCGLVSGDLKEAGAVSPPSVPGCCSSPSPSPSPAPSWPRTTARSPRSTPCVNTR